jgi:hypothetical protein
MRGEPKLTIELGSSLVEIFAVGTAVRKMSGMSVQTPNLPAQAIIRDRTPG